MKEKIGIIFIVVVAALCLFGCKENLPKEEMITVGDEASVANAAY